MAWRTWTTCGLTWTKPFNRRLVELNGSAFVVVDPVRRLATAVGSLGTVFLVRALVQRVNRARVTVGGDVVGEIGAGLCVLVGVTHSDDSAQARKLAMKVFGLRVFDDDQRVMNRSLGEPGAGERAEVLVVSQFTLYGDTTRGRRPSWSAAAPPEQAEPLVEAFCSALRGLGAGVATGRFGEHMLVELVNDGPVTVLLEV